MLLSIVAALAVTVASLWCAAGLVAVLRATRTRPLPSSARPPISVLKPLCGADPSLEANLESFFVQDHPDYELLFGVVDESDPALQAVARVRARHPHVQVRVVVHSGAGAYNPKVDNLLGLVPHATHDLLLVSDSNVRAPKHYLSELAALYDSERPGLLTNLFCGSDERSFGAALESVELSGFCAAGVALPTWLGDPLVVGKSTLFSRRRFEELGGFQRLRDVLAEDFVMGKTFAHAGDAVRVAPTVLCNVIGQVSVHSALARHLRWSMLRFRLRPTAAALEPLTSPLALLPLAWTLLGPWALGWALGAMWLRDVGGWLVLRGPERCWIPLLLSPVRDALSLVIWVIAPLKHHVSWRGKRFRLGAGTLLYPSTAR
ncbi:MAG: glycosyltransferase [Polyangiaceae bacterium]